MNLLVRFSRNLSFVLWARGFSAVASLVFLATAARAFGVATFGKLVFVLASTSFMELAFCGSADSILVREQTRQPDDYEQHFSACFFLQGCFALTVLVVTAILAILWRGDWLLSRGVIFAGLATTCQVMFVIPVAFFRSVHKMYFEATLITVERVFFLLGLLSVIYGHRSPVLIFVCLAATMGTKAVVAYAWFLRRWPVRKLQLRVPQLAYFWKESLPMMGVALLLSVHCRIDLFVMKALTSAEQLGIYAASFRAMEMLRTIPVDVITAAFPIFCSVAASQAGTEGQFRRVYGTFVRLGLLAATLGTGLAILFAGQLTHLLFGAKFTGSVLPMRILLVAFPMMLWNQIDNITLTATNRQKFMFYALLAAVTFQGLFDLLAISRWGAVGAGTGFVTGEAVLLIGTLATLVPLALDLKPTVASAAKLAVIVGILLWLGTVMKTSSWITGSIFAGGFVILMVLFRVATSDDVYAVSALTGRFLRSNKVDAAAGAIGS